MGVFVRGKWAASGAGTLAVGNFAILEVLTDFERKVLSLQSFMLKQALKLSKNFINFLLKKTILKNFKSWIHRCKL